MQMANSPNEDEFMGRYVRVAERSDAGDIQKLLQTGVYVHVHVDWRPPGEWLGSPGFVIFDENSRIVAGRRRGDVIACMAVTADPLPAAWVRVAAVKSNATFLTTQAMFGRVLENIDPTTTEISWFLADYWPLHWLERLGFEHSVDVISYQKDDLRIPDFAMPTGLQIRPFRVEDLPTLAMIDGAAFEPRWRHSITDLNYAWRNSLGFDVACMDGQPVAYQISTGSEGKAHLARISVHPSWQGHGIGAALLASAIERYRLRNVKTISLNTQADNHASHQLYERFGFRRTAYTYPVWIYYVK